MTTLEDFSEQQLAVDVESADARFVCAAIRAMLLIPDEAPGKEIIGKVAQLMVCAGGKDMLEWKTQS